MSTEIAHRRITHARALNEANIALPWGFPEFFVISQTLFPAILYLPGTQIFRLPLRVASFGISLFALFLWLSSKSSRNIKPHPAAHWLILVIVCLALMIFHPTTNTPLAGVAQTMLYLSVMAPVFWAPSMIKEPDRLNRLLVIMLVCNGINSLVGVLQVYAPDTWLPTEISLGILSERFGIAKYTFINAAGQRVIRPPGLFDTPGAVCSAGMIATMLGVVFALGRSEYWKRAAALALALLGVWAVYLSQVRTAILIIGGMLMVYVITVWLVQKKTTKAVMGLTFAGSIVVLGYSSAYFIGGNVITKRFTTLTAANPLAVYYQAGRGEQLEEGFTTLLPEHLLGAGLGRWGMMRTYFGDESNTDSSPIWAELQFPAWTLDGGIILVSLYCIALFVTARYEYLIIKNAKDKKLIFLSPIIFAANIGVLALILGFTPFTTQIGMQYWFLAGALHGVAQSTAFHRNEHLHINKR